jgi:hypothetical protein
MSGTDHLDLAETPETVAPLGHVAADADEAVSWALAAAVAG